MERNYNGDLVACFCQHCLASTAGFEMETSSTSGLSLGGDMDVDNNNMSNHFSHDMGSNYWQIPFSTEDNVFTAEENEVGNEQNDDNVINAEGIEFGDDDGSNNANEITHADQ
ncbi:hypothetical protein INT45_003181, partial [Circinella minor]